MTPRIHSVVYAGAFAIATWVAPFAHAQEAAPATGSVQEELRALRQLIEQQSRQIDMLTAQITRLGAQLGGSSPPLPGGNPGGEPAVPAAQPVRNAPPAAGDSPAANPNVHIIVKGDSLDKIAKQHHTTVTELMKLNKIPDPRKLQIGDQIVLPPKPQGQPPEKKEGQ